MAQTAQQKQQQQNQQILLALAAAFTGGVGGYMLLMTVRGLLVDLPFGLSYDLANWLATMASSPLPMSGGVGVPPGPCQVIESEHAAAWRAMYLVAAADRLALAGGLGASPKQAAAQAQEARYFLRHLEAEDRRMRSAALQDTAALLNADRETPSTDRAELLNWRAVMDDRTTFECRMADGKNFRADKMPLVGWPGAVHVHCRCSAGPEVPGAPLLPSV